MSASADHAARRRRLTGRAASVDGDVHARRDRRRGRLRRPPVRGLPAHGCSYHRLLLRLRRVRRSRGRRVAALRRRRTCRPRSPSPSSLRARDPARPTRPDGLRGTSVRTAPDSCWIAAGAAGCSAVVLVLIWGTGLGQSGSDLILYGAQAAALVGLVVAAVLALRAVWPGRPTSLRTRAFFVIAVAVLIPSFCLAMLGVWAYYRSWETATNLSEGQASYRASELARRSRRCAAARSVHPGAASIAHPRHRADVRSERAIAREPSWPHSRRSRETSTLAGWAIASLEKTGYAIGSETRSGRVAERRHRRVARRPPCGAVLRPGLAGRFSVLRRLLVRGPGAHRRAPLDRGVRMALIVVLGLLGAWLLLARRRAPRAPAGGGERPARRRRSRRHREAGGTARTAGAGGLVQRHERQADQGAGDRAGVPPLGQPRAQDAAHVHPRLRRGHRRRDREAATTAPK